MAVRSLGLVGIVNKGDYDPAATYVKGNFVYHMGSTWLCLYDNTSGIEPAESSYNWKYLAKGSGDMAYKVVTISQSDLASSSDSILPYYYDLEWAGTAQTNFVDATIRQGSYYGSFSVESMAGVIRIYFTRPLTEELTMYVYTMTSQVAEEGTPGDAYYDKTEIDEMNTGYLRLKNLGTAYTEELKEDIRSGSFKKACVGGCLTINDHPYAFAHPDYWLGTGDTKCTTHHMVVVPLTALGTGQMNTTNTTAGAYVGSYMRSSGGPLDQVKAIIRQDFGASNILTHREHFANAVTNGYESAISWYDSDIDLMNEIMVYGSNIYHNITNGTNVPINVTMDKTQLKLFSERPDLLNNIDLMNETNYVWLRDVCDGGAFTCYSPRWSIVYALASTYSFSILPAFAVC